LNPEQSGIDELKLPSIDEWHEHLKELEEQRGGQ
jgi:hypothetical protein